MSRPVAVVQPRLRIRLTKKKSAQVHCCWEIEALVVLLADLMIVRQVCFYLREEASRKEMRYLADFGNKLFGQPSYKVLILGIEIIF